MSRLQIGLVVVAHLLVTSFCIADMTVTLDFDSPVPGTIKDSNGHGTGFTHRLPGTGGALPEFDPNLDLNAVPGRLRLISTNSDINHANNLGQLDAPGLLFSNMAGRDFSVSVSCFGVNLPNGSDQLFLYVGTSATNVVRAGFHEQGVYTAVANQGAGDFFLFLSPLNSFAPGDDAVLTLGRTDNSWSLSWQNLTSPSESSSSTPFSVPWLDSEDTLYIGVLSTNPGSAHSHLDTIDHFSVTVVPETSSVVLGLLGFSIVAIRSRSKGATIHLPN